MKSFWTLIFFFTFALQGEPLVLKELYKEWESFTESGKLKDFGFAETSKSIQMIFGDSYNKSEHIQKVQIQSIKLEEGKLQVFIDFPEVVLDISEITVKENISYELISRSAKLPVDSEKSYELEFYGIHSVQSLDGKTFKKDKAVKFGSLKLLSSKDWLKKLAVKLEVEDNSRAEFKKFLTSEVENIKFEKASSEEISAGLKKIFKENSYDLIFLPGTGDPDGIKTYNFSYQKASALELVQRFAALENLRYKLGKTEVIIATDEAFKLSKAMSSKEGLDLPGLKVDVKSGRMFLDAKVCLNSGILEYLICLPNSFEHESVFLTKVKPELIHMGLLLIQAEQMPYEGRSAFMKKIKENKSRLKIEVEWKNGEKNARVDLNRLLIDRSQKDKKTIAEDLWFFAGSYFTEKNVYAANIHMSIISLQQHPASVIHYGKETADPYRSQRGGFEINNELCPPVNAEVKLVFSLHK